MELLVELLSKMPLAALAHLRKRVSDQRAKLKLIDVIVADGVTDNQTLMEATGYLSNRQAFYTLKHRLIEDIQEQKVEFGKNPITDTLEKVNNLRVLLYSEDFALLDKNLKHLEKRVKELEVYSAAVEVFFCYYLLYYNEPKKRAYYQSKVEDAQQQYSIYSNLEITFYEVVFQSLDVFYYRSPLLENALSEHITKSEQLHKQLESNISHFFWLSSKLTIELAPGKPITEKHLVQCEELLHLFENSSVKYRYRGCAFAIKCLLNRYYYLSGNHKAFQESLKSLTAQIVEIKGYRMYENVYFYYLYINILHLVDVGNLDAIPAFIKANLNDDLVDKSSKKIQFYFLFILALGHFYKREYSEAHSALLKARELKQVIEHGNAWIFIENVALTILIQLIYPQSNTFHYELKTLKKLLGQYETSQEVWKLFTQMVTAFNNGNEKKGTTLLSSFDKHRKDSGELRLLNLDYLVENLRKIK